MCSPMQEAIQMGFRSAFLFVILAAVGVIPASAQQQLGQWCHSGQTDPLHGLYCTAINSSFVPQQGTGYLTSIEGLERTDNSDHGFTHFRTGSKRCALRR
jgi:hypothetical protein